MKKQKKYFRVAFVEEGNKYGIQFDYGDGWKSECLYKGIESGKHNEFWVHENLLWKINNHLKLGNEMLYIVYYKTEKGFWDVDEEDMF